MGRLALPLIALALAATWLVHSISHLIGSATAYHVRVVARPAGVAAPSGAEVQRLLADQNHWAALAMFAVAGAAGALVLILVVWLLGVPRARPDRQARRGL